MITGKHHDLLLDPMPRLLPGAGRNLLSLPRGPAAQTNAECSVEAIDELVFGVSPLDDLVTDLFDSMSRNAIRSLAVLCDGRPFGDVGILSRSSRSRKHLCWS